MSIHALVILKRVRGVVLAACRYLQSLLLSFLLFSGIIVLQTRDVSRHVLGS
jgi:hypothetical protein